MDLSNTNIELEVVAKVTACMIYQFDTFEDAQEQLLNLYPSLGQETISDLIRTLQCKHKIKIKRTIFHGNSIHVKDPTRILKFVPKSPLTGEMYFNTVDNNLKTFNGKEWINIK